MTDRRSVSPSLSTLPLTGDHARESARLARMHRRALTMPTLRRGTFSVGALAWVIAATLTGCVHAESPRLGAIKASTSTSPAVTSAAPSAAELSPIDVDAAMRGGKSAGAPAPSYSRRQILAGIVAKCGVSRDHRPCLMYDTAGDDVLLKDIRGQSQFLLLPISSISGIESPALLRSDIPSYLYEAWNQRRYVIAALGKPLRDDEISLAINPINARSQDHLHIHIDCVRADVRDALAAASISTAWSEAQIDGESWRVRRMSVDSLRRDNLFAVIARDIPGAAADMGRHTVFVTGAPSRVSGAADAAALYVAVRRVPRPLFGGPNAEDLQDHACGVASQRTIGPRATP